MALTIQIPRMISNHMVGGGGERKGKGKGKEKGGPKG
jgi:hypothetical protein